MIRSGFFAILDGYGSGETDFMVRFGQSEEPVQIMFDNTIFTPILDVLNSQDQSATIIIVGHSDRVDTEGLTREQRRLQELTASEARAISAAEAVKQIIRDNLPGFVPADPDQIQQLAFMNIPAGAAELVVAEEGLNEDQRRLNRRVEMTVVRFQPG